MKIENERQLCFHVVLVLSCIMIGLLVALFVRPFQESWKSAWCIGGLTALAAVVVVEIAFAVCSWCQRHYPYRSDDETKQMS